MEHENIFIEIAPDTSSLYHLTATWFVESVKRTLDTQACFHLALSGGSTPKAFYELLASDLFRDQIDWLRVHLYFGDERSVAQDHADSNFRMAYNALISKVPVPESNVHAMPIYQDALHKGAQEYAELIACTISARHDNIAVFDLVLLGMGDDGHTASLFPDTTILKERDKWVDAVYVQKMQTWRVSFTYPLINAAARVAFLVAGENKAQKVHEVLQKKQMIYPIEYVKPQGEAWWFLDDAAAGLLV